MIKKWLDVTNIVPQYAQINIDERSNTLKKRAVQRRKRNFVTIQRILVIRESTSSLSFLDTQIQKPTLMMKKLLSLMAILAIIFSSNCSRIEQNDDPIIGIWIEATSSSETSTAKSTTRKEWIFNDVFLGRYHEIQQGQIILQTDFKWSQVDGIYTVEYRGLENKPNDIVTIKTTEDGTLLQQTDGRMFAVRE
ncbi:hypothetical protein ACFQZJ_04945 [Maribacter chungangensis]|uniref:Lipocalin-like domain-containing protein n=1 Tax=Maribacter chungangensis TaxID=1069117 RepID=A0ABW3B0Z8_9FLAO